MGIKGVPTGPFRCTLCIPGTSKLPPSGCDTVLERGVILLGIFLLGISRILFIPRGIARIGTFRCNNDAAVDPKSDEREVEDEREDENGADPVAKCESRRLAMPTRLNKLVERSDTGDEEGNDKQRSRIDFGAVGLSASSSAVRGVRRKL